MQNLILIYNYVRSYIGLFILGVNTIFWCALGWLFHLIVPQPRLGTFIMRGWSWVLLRAVSVRVVVKGLENLPKEPSIIVFNHSSHFDIPCLVNATPRQIRFGAKIELFSIPVFGPTMRLIGMLPIARSNREKVLEIYRQAVVRIKNGEWFCLAPEGTRQDGAQLGAFKKGPFIFAVAAQCNLVPVVIKGAHKVIPKGDIIVNRGRWSSDVVVEFLPPISALGTTEQDVDRLHDLAFEAMTRAYTRA